MGSPQAPMEDNRPHLLCQACMVCSAGEKWAYLGQLLLLSWGLGTPGMGSLLLRGKGHKMSCCYIVPPVLQSLTSSPLFAFQTFSLMASGIICRVYSYIFTKAGQVEEITLCHFVWTESLPQSLFEQDNFFVNIKLCNFNLNKCLKST